MVMFFFVKQKTAYEVLRSLVGSEMCIRDRDAGIKLAPLYGVGLVFLSRDEAVAAAGRAEVETQLKACLLYTSDAADDLPCVDLGGRRIMKKKNTQHTQIDSYLFKL